MLLEIYSWCMILYKKLLDCICHFPGFEGLIDISKFRSLRRLEVHKIHIKRITGIQPLRTQLQHLICNRSLNSVEDTITYCGGDNPNGFAWNELQTATFSYGNLKNVDSSLEFAQWLQYLTLSYNQLTSVEAIKWLPHLKILDLRFNRLNVLPNFHTEASRRLQVLIISNNFIEDLRVISRLEALTELDLSSNLLLDHVNLLPLSTLVSLRYLNLQDNPLSFILKHREITASYLNRNTSSVKFILDAEPLSKVEKALTGRFPNYYSALTSRLSLNTRSSRQSTSTRKSQAGTPDSSVGSVRSLKLNEKEEIDMSASIVEKEKKNLKIRTVKMEDSKNHLEDVIKTTTNRQSVGNKAEIEQVSSGASSGETPATRTDSLPTDAMQVKVPQLMSSSNFCPSQLHVDQIMPGIYLTNSSELWTPEKLRSHGFTHIINIDKHIQGYFSSRNDHNYDRTQNDLSQQFETLDLNFGEKSYLTTVLPNCYKAVKFIDKALQNGGAILIIDRNSNQKCLTIVTAYLMYKNNLNFNDAFQRIKKVFKKAELERYFISQLYEYEPILQVQKAQARGNSCSRELRSAFLKRKKLHDDSSVQIDYNYNYHLNHIHINNNYHDSGDVLME